MTKRFGSTKTGHGDNIAVVKIDKSGGCVDRDNSFLQQSRQAQIRKYFFGDSKNTLSPHMQQVDFAQVHIYKLTEGECIDICPAMEPFWLTMLASKPSTGFFPARRRDRRLVEAPNLQQGRTFTADAKRIDGHRARGPHRLTREHPRRQRDGIHLRCRSGREAEEAEDFVASERSLAHQSACLGSMAGRDWQSRWIIC